MRRDTAGHVVAGVFIAAQRARPAMGKGDLNLDPVTSGGLSEITAIPLPRLP